MKKILQFVALVLMLLVGAGPVFAEGDCVQRTCCGDHCTADCCGHPVGMTMRASAMRLDLACEHRGCCMVSAGTVPMVMPAASAAAGQLSMVAAIEVQTRFPLWMQAKSPPGHRAAVTTARYILFHDFRI
jgi:hypothetical protein